MKSPQLRLYLFGGFRAQLDDGRLVDLPRQQPAALLAFLAINIDRSRTRDELMVAFWPDDPPEVARHKLRQTLYAVRRQLQDLGCDPKLLLRSSRDIVGLNISHVSTDISDFEKALKSARQTSQPSERIGQLSQAISLYTGDISSGFYLDALEVDSNRLRTAYLDGLHDLMSACRSVGDLDQAIEASRKIVNANPLIEEAHCDLMRLYAAKGQHSAVLRQFNELKRILTEELGENPSLETQAQVEELRHLPKLTLEPLPAADVTISETERSLPSDSWAVPIRQHNRHRFVVIIAACAGISVCLILFGIGARLIGHSSAHTAPDRPAKSGSPPTVTTSPELNQELWVTRYVPAVDEKGSEPTAITTDKKHNIYVAGFAETTKDDADFLTLKFDPNGKLLWHKRYSGPLYKTPPHDLDRARCITVDDEGNVYVSGESDNGNGNGATRLAGVDIATIKYGPDGEPSPTWPDVGFGVGVRRYNGPNDGEDCPVQIELSQAGDLYVLGKSWTRGPKDGVGGFGAVLLRYGKDGRETSLWRYYSGHGGDLPVGMALGHNGAIYVAMTSRAEPPSGPETDFLTVKVDIAGHELWSDRFGERNQTDDTVLAMGADERENVYVAGTARGLPGTLDAVKKSAVVISYDRTGHRRWLRGSMTETDRISAPWTAKVWTSGNTMLFGLATNAKGDRVTRAVFRYDDGSIAWTADYQNDIRADYADLAGEGGPAFACAVLNGGILTFRYVDENNPSQWIRAWRPAEAGPHVRVSFIHSPLLVSVACQATKIPGGPRHITLLAYKP